MELLSHFDKLRAQWKAQVTKAGAWDVMDPNGKMHRVIRTDDGYWHGDENLAESFTPNVSKPYIRTYILTAIQKYPEMGDWTMYPGMPEGYAWLKV